METIMHSISPLNTNTVIIQQALIEKTSILNEESAEVNSGTPDLGDLVEISKLATEKQQQSVEIETSKQIKEIAIDVVNVSSTIGRARSSNNLTTSQATELYQKIAKLL